MKLLILLFCLLLTGCAAPIHTTQYSNLANSNSIKEVREVLAQKKISTAHIDTYFNWVKDLNKRAASSLQGDFTAMLNDTISYTKFAYQASDYPEISAKLAAFVLIQDDVQAKTKILPENTELTDDLSFLSNTLSMNEEYLSTYYALFQSIPLADATTLGEHITQVQNTMKEADVQFASSLQVYLIRLYVHNPLANTRYVEHAGILIEKNKDLLFLEKVGSGYPFQATKFDNRTQLIHYLMQRNLPTSQDTLPPFLLENNQVLDMRK